ncbi:hypothetical protein BKH46_03385 [Helicobacter sp. 12S02634-8]|uniref:vacuolating cyotoxin family protein n=1 Tax=Helicobacter sp. 12S02634-8 TaxID=1476199 RepID=UPI000BA7A19C|nr:vacuolating cyotoxin family protein [Helicobacter sp. 12S02634-8]PAF47493.1 hypothetical protein BKH46_03385 [Helicobacter sp. 12S02634-8]
MARNLSRIKTYFLFSAILATTIMPIDINASDITSDVYNLSNKSNTSSGDFYVKNTQTWYGGGWTGKTSFTQSYNNGTLIFGNNSQSASNGVVRFGSLGYTGYIIANFNAKDIYITGTLESGNAWKTGGGAAFNFKATNNITLDGATIRMINAGAQNSSARFEATQKISFKNTTLINDNSGSSNFSISGDQITFTQVNVSLNQGGSLTLESKQKSSVDIAKFSANTGSITAKNIDLKVTDTTSNIYVGNLGTFSVSASSFNFGGTIELRGILTAGGNSTLNVSGVTGQTTIHDLKMTTASVYGGNFNITTLTAHKGASRSVFYSNIGKSTIDTLYVADNGTSNADNSILEFRGGGDSLSVKTLKTDKWAILDASKINQLTITTLESNYSTIKAKSLALNNGTFSSGATYLYADNTTSSGTISLDNQAELWLKSGQTFHAATLDMKNGSKLYAASDHGGMSGTTTIDHINFDNSQIYANNLITKDITIKNNANVFLSKGSTYTNQGDLNIADGSYLQIHNGDFTNQGQLNITLGADPSKNAQTLINVLDGSFTFDMTKISSGKTDTYKDANGIPLVFTKGSTADNPINPYYATFEATSKDANGKTITLERSQIDLSKIQHDDKGHYYITQTNNGQSTNYYLQFINAKGEKIATDDTGHFSKTKAETEGYTKLTGDIKIPKATINVKLDLAGLSVGNTYNLLTTKNGILFKDGTTSYNSTQEQYATYKAELNQRMFFTSTDGSAIGVDYWISDDNKSIGFKYNTGKHYTDAAPFIKPGTWVFGIGSGAAAFGSMGGIPGASGLAKSYTLKLQAQKYHNAISNQDENIVYYLKNLDYNNYGTTTAVFTIDAKGSDFALGKDQDIGGSSGVINIGPYNAKSTMVLQADNIYLGGTINLGDGALISGHLDLQAKTTDGTLGKIVGDDKNATIYVKNHSSLKAIGSSFDYKGTIHLYANSSVSDEVGLDLSGVTGKITIGAMSAWAARPNGVDKNAGIKMKDFDIGTLTIGKGNGFSINNYYSEFTTNIGTSTIGTLTLAQGTSGTDQSGLKFSGGGTSLTIDTLNVGSWSFLDASKINDVYIGKTLNLPYSPQITFDGGVHGVMFNNLTLNEGSVMHYGGQTDLTIKGNFTNKYGLMDITPNGSAIQTINITGNASFYFNDNKTSDTGIATPLIKISDVKGLKLNQKYTLFKAGGTITYYYKNKEGNEIVSSDKTKAEGLYNEMADRIALINSDGSAAKGVEKVVNDKEIAFTINESDATNPYDPNDIRYWFYKRGGQNWLQDIENTGNSVMDWLQVLMIDKHNGLWAKDRVLSNNLDYFIRIGKQLDSTMGQLSSVNRKNNSTAATRLATDVSRTNRLVKLSNTRANTPSFADMLRGLENKRFADTSSPTAMLYKYANRNTYKNNIWATAIGTASFVQGGNSTLYGINAGYDRLIGNVIIGGYVAYAQGQYTGDIIRNHSYNVNAGLYSRAYLDNAEFDLSVSQTTGFNKEAISSQDLILNNINQSYSYYTYTTNLNVNYGYLFAINNKSIILKPQIGLSYYYIAATKILGQVANPQNRDLAIEADPDQKQNVTLNLAIETRQYFNNLSYWYFIAGVNKDIFLTSKGDQEVRFIGNNTLSYKKGDQLNTYASLMAGGEMGMSKRLYVNLGLGAKAGIVYKDINISGNIGMRYVF